MYGMFHRGLHQLVCDELGVPAWQQIEADLGIGPREQISLEGYDDDLTLSLMQAVAGAMELPFDQFLEQFGQFWIRYVGQGHYADAIRFAGGSLREFLGNLDRLHLGVSTMLPTARVPSFAVTDLPGGLGVTYRSSRTGLEPVVLGLLRGLLVHFGETGEVTMLPPGDGPQVYHITLQAKASPDAA